MPLSKPVLYLIIPSCGARGGGGVTWGLTYGVKTKKVLEWGKGEGGDKNGLNGGIKNC